MDNTISQYPWNCKLLGLIGDVSAWFAHVATDRSPASAEMWSPPFSHSSWTFDSVTVHWMISYAGSLDALRGPLSWYYWKPPKRTLHLAGHNMILHDRSYPAPLHSKRRFVNLPGLIFKRLIWSYQSIWNPVLFVLRPSPHAQHGLVSSLHAPQKGNVMCTDCTTQTFTVRWDLFSTLRVLLPQWSVQLIYQHFWLAFPVTEVWLDALPRGFDSMWSWWKLPDLFHRWVIKSGDSLL